MIYMSVSQSVTKMALMSGGNLCLCSFFFFFNNSVRNFRYLIIVAIFFSTTVCLSYVVLRTLHNGLSFNNHSNAMRWIIHLIDEETEDGQS